MNGWGKVSAQRAHEIKHGIYQKMARPSPSRRKPHPLPAAGAGKTDNRHLLEDKSCSKT